MRLTAWHWAGIASAAGGLGFLAWRWLSPDGEAVDTSEDTTSPDSPQGLAAAAGVPLVQYALARAIASEAGGQPFAAQVAVGWTIQNYADAHKGGDIVAAILGKALAFGPQGSGGRGYVSTSRAPGAAQLELAGRIIAEQIGDPTGGATNFDSPREQDREAAANPERKNSVQVAMDRANQGLALYQVDVGSADFRFWGPA